MLPRNLSPGEGLCGGTRLIVRGMRAGGRLLECARPGAAAGRDSTVLVARVDHHSPDDGTFALVRMRRQFPGAAGVTRRRGKRSGARACGSPSRASRTASSTWPLRASGTRRASALRSARTS